MARPPRKAPPRTALLTPRQTPAPSSPPISLGVPGPRREVRVVAQHEPEPSSEGLAPGGSPSTGASVRRLEVGPGSWVWAVEPYRGCALGCVLCPLRQGEASPEAWRDFALQVGARGRVVGALVAALGQAGAGPRRLVLGAGSEPWQPAEERHRLTRALLEALLPLAPVDLQVHTRSSLIARDTDVLRALSQRGRVTVAFSLASLDARLNLLLEPHAPSALRRLTAMEALARAGLLVGVRVSPALATLEPAELEALLSRAAQAGARFAELGVRTFSPAERARLLQQVGQALPDQALRVRRVLERAARVSPQARAGLRQAFVSTCERLGLVPLEAPEGTRSPVQLSLFPTH